MSKGSPHTPRGRRPKKPRKATDVARTALGAEPEKRGRKAPAPSAGSQPGVSGDADAPARGDLKVRVKTARGRKLSSTRWLQRQLNDPYVARAKAAGYRSRAAFKLIGLDEAFGLLKPGARVADIGAAPGGWCQVAAERVGAAGHVVGIDVTPMEPLPGVRLIEGDFLDPAIQAETKAALGGPADVALSDMAAPSSGHKATDHLRIIALCEAALDFAEVALRPGGAFAAKVLQGGADGELLQRMKQGFARVRHFKPPASRSDSAEMYVVATGFRGGEDAADGDHEAPGGA
ncbi:MAG: RlmE family RNA methyltransferase [Pseudomonadota bacterium]